MRQATLKALQYNEIIEKESEFVRPEAAETYPEMEYFWPYPPGFDFSFPIPQLDGNTADNPPDAEDYGGLYYKFVGCVFQTVHPMSAEPGQTVIAILEERDDPVVSCKAIGPCSIVQCGQKVCKFKINDDAGDSGAVSAGVEATTRLGLHCQATVFIDDNDCTEITPLSWDSENPEDIGTSASVVIRVKDGKGPFAWSVDGTGFWLATNRTQANDRDNVLFADANACGTATITVYDECFGEAIGYIFCTNGQWNEVSPASCAIPGAHDEITVSGSRYIRYEGKYRQIQDIKTTKQQGGAYYQTEESCITCEETNCDELCNAYDGCDPVIGCTECITVIYSETYSGSFPCWERCYYNVDHEGWAYQLHCCCIAALYLHEWGCP